MRSQRPRYNGQVGCRRGRLPLRPEPLRSDASLLQLERQVRTAVADGTLEQRPRHCRVPAARRLRSRSDAKQLAKSWAGSFGNSSVAVVGVTLVQASRADTPVLDRLLQLYEYDFSEYGGIDVDATGAFATVDTATIWQPDDHVFLIQVDDKLAGFAFVSRHQSYIGDGRSLLLSEFFVMRKYRRRGIGEHVARRLFDQFPGRWELGTPSRNTAAHAFWRAVLGRYTNGRYKEIAEGCERWQGPIWIFVSSGDRTLAHPPEHF